MSLLVSETALFIWLPPKSRTDGSSVFDSCLFRELRSIPKPVVLHVSCLAKDVLHLCLGPFYTVILIFFVCAALGLQVRGIPCRDAGKLLDWGHKHGFKEGVLCHRDAIIVKAMFSGIPVLSVLEVITSFLPAPS